MTMTRRVLLVVAKQPAPGQTKTRLTPPLDGTAASAIYECFLRDTLETIRQARQKLDFDPIIAFLPAGAQGYFRDLAPDFGLLVQHGQDLSERLANATGHTFVSGYSQVVIMDSDSPTLPPANLCSAFEVMDSEADVSLGPCDDGGYYLIGLKRAAPNLFLNVTMSTPHVVMDTLAEAATLNLKVHMLPASYDIDYAEDLQRLITELHSLPPQIAVHTRAFLATHPELPQGQRS